MWPCVVEIERINETLGRKQRVYTGALNFSQSRMCKSTQYKYRDSRVLNIHAEKYEIEWSVVCFPAPFRKLLLQMG